MIDRQPYRALDALDLGRPLSTFRRTAGQNAGVAGLVLLLFALPVGLALTASSPDAYAFATIFAVVALFPTALIARQIVPNWNVRWVLHERGFTRSRRGTREQFAYEQVAAVSIRPVREALVQLESGQQLVIEGLSEGAELAAALEQAVARVALPRYASLLQAGGEVVLGRVAIGASGVRVDETWFDWSDVTATAVATPSPVPGAAVETWQFASLDGLRTAQVPVTAIPLPTVARTLIRDRIDGADAAATTQGSTR